MDTFQFMALWEELLFSSDALLNTTAVTLKYTTPHVKVKLRAQKQFVIIIFFVL